MNRTAIALSLLMCSFALAEDWRDVDVRATLDYTYAGAVGPVVTEQSSCYYSTQTVTTETQGAQCRVEWLAPVTETIYDACGRPCGTKVVEPSRCVRIWTPPKYETRTIRVFNDPTVCVTPVCSTCPDSKPREITLAPDRGLRPRRHQDRGRRGYRRGYRSGYTSHHEWY